MSQSILFTPSLREEAVSSHVFPNGDYRQIHYPKGILEELTAEYNLDKPTYKVEPRAGPSFQKLCRTKCTVNDSHNVNTFLGMGDGARTIREGEHSTATGVLKEFTKTYYFSEKERPKESREQIYVMAKDDPEVLKLKLYKWANCGEYCYFRGHVKEGCRGINRNKQLSRSNSESSDEFWNLPGPSVEKINPQYEEWKDI